MLPFIEWVFEQNTLTKQHLVSYRKMYGPADDFDNLTMGEWNACEIFYNGMVQHKDTESDMVNEGDEDALNKLVAVLYRLPKPKYDKVLNSDGDIRMPFNENEIDFYKKKIARWPAAVKMAIVLWYDGCREHLKEQYDLFDNADSGDGEPGMFELIRGMCGKRYGNFKEVEKMNVHIVMRELEMMKKEAEEMPRA